MVFSYMVEKSPATVIKSAAKQYGEQDWCPPEQHGRHGSVTPTVASFHPQQDGRDAYFEYHQSGDLRDTQMPANNVYHHVRATPPSSPSLFQRHAYQPNAHPVPNSYQNETDRSYIAAIRAVNDSMNVANESNGQNNFSINALRGLWRLFDAGIGELSEEMLDSLSSKALFEACVLQETSERQGKRISDNEKKLEASHRRQSYEARLKSTLLRLRGSFADVFLVVTNDIQTQINKSIQEIQDEYEKKYESREAILQKEIQQDIQKEVQEELQKRVEIEVQNVREKANLEIAEVRRSSENQNNILNQEIQQSQLVITQLRAEIAKEREHILRTAEAAQHGRDNAVTNLSSTLEVLQATANERDQLRRVSEIAQHERDNAVSKLNSTLEALQVTTASAQSTESKLRECEGMLQRSFNMQKELEERVHLESERARLMQNKLDAELRNKDTLSRVRTEIEKHLSLERERANLLQLELDTANQSKQGLVTSYREGENHLRDELERMRTLNVQLREQLKVANEAGSLLNEKVQRMQPHIDNTMFVFDDAKRKNSQLSNELQTCRDQLNVTTTLKSQMESLLTEVRSENSQLSDTLNKVKDENSKLTVTLNAAQSELSKLVQSVNEVKDDNTKLAVALNAAREEISQLVNTLNETKSDNTQLTTALNAAKTEGSQLITTVNELKRENINLTTILSGGRMEQVQSENAQLAKTLNEMREQNSKLATELNAAHVEVSQLTNKVDEVNKDNTQLATVLHGTRIEYPQVVKELNEVKQKNENLSNALIAFKNENSQLAYELEEVKNMNSELSNNLEARNNERSQLVEELHKVNSEMLQLSNGLTTCKEKLSMTLQDNKQLATALNGAKDEVSQLSNAFVMCEDNLNKSLNECTLLATALGKANEENTQLSVALESCKKELKMQADNSAALVAKLSHLEAQILEINGDNSKLMESLNSYKDHLSSVSDVNSHISAKAAKLEAIINDQVLELQAAKLSEAEVEASLNESLQRNEELIKKLKQLEHEMHTMTGRIQDECREKMQKIEALKEATQLMNDFEKIIKDLESGSQAKSFELEKLRKSKEVIESERESLKQNIKMLEEKTIKSLEDTLEQKCKLISELSEAMESLNAELTKEKNVSLEKIEKLELLSTESSKKLDDACLEIEKLRKLNDGLESERISLREKLGRCQEEYNIDRDKIAEALLGFDDEMSHAETKIKSMIDELEKEKAKVKELTETQALTENHAKTVELDLIRLQNEVGDLNIEYQKQRNDLSNMENKCKSKQEQIEGFQKMQSDHEQELSVYKEAIKMLQEKLEKESEPHSNLKTIANDNKMIETEEQWMKLLEKEKKLLDKKNALKDQDLMVLHQELSEKTRSVQVEKRHIKASKSYHGATNKIASIQNSKESKNDLAKSSCFYSHVDENWRSKVMRDFDEFCSPIDPSRQITAIAAKEQQLEMGSNHENLFSSIDTQVSCDDKEAQTEVVPVSQSW